LELAVIDFFLDDSTLARFPGTVPNLGIALNCKVMIADRMSLFD
jgi:hypothetical protein